MAMEGSADLKPFVQPPAPKTFRQAGVVPDPSLAAGQQLPARLRAAGRFNPDQIGVPLQDPDPAYDGFDTFIVITDRCGTIARFAAHRAMSIFTPMNPVRLSAINIIHHWAFTWLIVLVIAGNYWTRQMLDMKHDDARWRWTVTISEVLFMSACVFELSMKFIAFGVAVGPFTTMRSPWAWLDVLFIITGIIMIWWPTTKLFRIIAALRTLKIIPVTRVLLNGWRVLIKTKERLFDVLIYSVLVIIGLSLVGQSTFWGLMRHKCIERMDPGQHFGAAEWHAWNRNPTHWLLAPNDQDEFFVCGNETRKCPPAYICLAGYGTNPNYGYTFYDNFGWAALATVRIIAQDAVDALFMQIPTTSSLQQLLYFLAIFFIGTWAIVGFGFAITASVIEEEVALKVKKRCREARGEDDDEDQPGPPSGGCRSWAYRVVNSHIFDKFIVLVSLLVLVLFAWHYHGIEQDHPSFFWGLRAGLTFLLSMYIVEAWLQLFADGPRRFACNPLHVYESIMGKIILVTFFKWYLWDFGVSVLDTAIFTLPVVKLAIRWRALRTLGRVTRDVICGYGGSQGQGAYFWLGILATLVLGEVGTLLFSRDYLDHVDYFPHHQFPRWHFGDLAHSFLMVLRVACGEWVQSLFACLLVGNVSCLLYFLATLFIMYLILMHVNVSIVKATVDELARQEEKDREGVDNGNGRVDNQRDGRGNGGRGRVRIADPESDGEGKLSRLGKLGKKKYVSWIGEAARKRRGQVLNYEDGAEAAGSIVDGARQPSAPGPKGLHIPQGGCFVGFQDSLADIYTHYAFKAVSIANVLLSTAALATDDVYINEGTGHELRIATRVVNIIFVVILVIEIVVKLIAFGWTGFGTSVECLLDLLMLVERVWCFFWFGFSTSSHLNPIAGLRPLMLIFRLQALHAPARALVSQWWTLKGYVLASAVIWLFFALVGHQLYSGKFYKCLDHEGNVPDYRLIHDKHACMASNYTWVNSQFNFDGEIRSFISFFAVATFNGWTSVLEDALDARGVDMQPHRESSPYSTDFFIAFVICGVLLLGNILVGVLVYEFRNRRMLERLMTKDQYEAREAIAEASSDANDGGYSYNIEIPRPTSPILEIFFDFVESPPIEPIIVVVIGLDLACCVLYFILGSISPHVLWIVFFWIFTFLYTAEMGVKALAWRCHMLRNYPNLLDLVAVVASFIIGVFRFNLTIWGLRILLRAVFLLKYVPFTLKHISGTRPRSILLNAASRVTPALTNLIALLVVIMAAFALIGLAEFKHVAGHNPPAPPLNFQTFCSSMMVMIQLSMVAGWNNVYNYIGNEIECDEADSAHSKPGTCGNWRIALAFIFVYILISILVVTNMFLVLVLEIVDQLRVRQGQNPLMRKAGAGGGGGDQDGRDGGGTQLQTMVTSPPATATTTTATAPEAPEPDPQQPQSPPRESVVTVNENGENPEAVVVVPT